MNYDFGLFLVSLSAEENRCHEKKRFLFLYGYCLLLVNYEKECVIFDK